MTQKTLPTTGTGATFVTYFNDNAADVEAFKTSMTSQLATKIAQGGTLTANLSAGNHKITGLATPTATTDAVTKSYVDTLISDEVREWAPSTAYRANEVVIVTGGTEANGQFTGALFVVLKAHTSGTQFPASGSKAYITTDGNYRLTTPEDYLRTKTYQFPGSGNIPLSRVGNLITSSGVYRGSVTMPANANVYTNATQTISDELYRPRNLSAIVDVKNGPDGDHFRVIINPDGTMVWGSATGYAATLPGEYEIAYLGQGSPTWDAFTV